MNGGGSEETLEDRGKNLGTLRTRGADRGSEISGATRLSTDKVRRTVEGSSTHHDFTFRYLSLNYRGIGQKSAHSAVHPQAATSLAKTIPSVYYGDAEL